ncbi:bifunctional DNA primase/polymerase [Kitasatospora azatica]|uniref:bifunctional DNA primase/polymerase n=1 Tax=Kitasatospora azatica TaxID=58347 RepID=UPI00068B9FBC|nr:bifunctional DNA primase/polymerase [Kitasatospora azatica]
MPRTPARAQHPGPWWPAARAHALTAAVLYGHKVAPLTRSKLPAIASAHKDDIHSLCTGQCGTFGHGIHDASSNPEQVKAMFAAAPWAAGYAIACGQAPHHLFGLDLDRKNGTDGIANFHALTARHGFALPPTAAVTTQSGGLHVWLTAPDRFVVPNTAGLLAPGVDTRGTGGYLVGPGSAGTLGRYAFAPGTDPRTIAPAPAELLALLTARHDTTGAPHGQDAGRPAAGPRRRLDGLVRTVREAPGGERNNRLYWAARTALAAGIDPATALGELTDAARETGLDEEEIQHVFRNAGKGAARDRAGVRG